jgi:hypothetical protein
VNSPCREAVHTPWVARLLLAAQEYHVMVMGCLGFLAALENPPTTKGTRMPGLRALRNAVAAGATLVRHSSRAHDGGCTWARHDVAVRSAGGGGVAWRRLPTGGAAGRHADLLCYVGPYAAPWQETAMTGMPDRAISVSWKAEDELLAGLTVKFPSLGGRFFTARGAFSHAWPRLDMDMRGTVQHAVMLYEETTPLYVHFSELTALNWRS